MKERDCLRSRVSISPDVISQQVQLGETLLLNTRTLAYFGLDPLGSEFWTALQTEPLASRVVEAVAARTGRPPHELGPRFAAILEGMARSGIVELLDA